MARPAQRSTREVMRPVSRSAERRTKPPVVPTLAAEGTFAVPIATLADEYHDERAEPVDSERVPTPEPPGAVHRAMDALARWLGRGRSG